MSFRGAHISPNNPSKADAVIISVLQMSQQRLRAGSLPRIILVNELHHSYLYTQTGPTDV